MVFRGRLLCAAFLLSALGPTAGARAEVTPDATEAQSTAERDLGEYFNQLSAGDFRKALSSADKLKGLNSTAEWKAVVTSLRAGAFLGMKRDGEAMKLFAEAERLGGPGPLAVAQQYSLAMIVGNVQFATDALDKMIARFPDQVRQLSVDGVSWLLRENRADKARDGNRRVALAQLGYGGEAQGDYLAQEAIGILLTRGDLAAAADILRYVDEPQLVEDMLVQRRYQAIWPALERRAGPQLSSVRASALKVAERDYAEDPKSSEKLHQLANALRHVGKHDQAIALAAKLPATTQAMALADEDMGWAVNNVALALHEMGRGDEADQLFARLNDAPMKEGEGGWRVSMLINRLELLVADGKFDRAEQLLDRTEGWAKEHGNPYAQQLVRRLRICTVASLGRKDEATKLLPGVIKHAADARHATVDGLLCTKDYDQAEALVLAGLEDEHFQGQLVRSLQPIPLTSDDPSLWGPAGWASLRKRPPIAAAYARLGRDMPAPLLAPSPSSAASE